MRAVALLLLLVLLSACVRNGTGLIGSGGGASRGSYVDIAPDGTRRVVRVSP